MPNTLGHIGVQGIISRLAFPDVDARWVFLACIVPDIPWILQRLAQMVFPLVDIYSLRAYCIVQASLFNSLLLCVALALFAKRPGRIFSVLAVNSVLHLVLDAMQTKWANGVHFFAPFSWELMNWGLFWPEHWVSYLISGLGVVFFILGWKHSLRRRIEMERPKRVKAAGVIITLFLYFLIPCLMIDKPLQANNHYIETLSTPGSKAGKRIECDRAGFHKAENAEEGVVQCWDDTAFHVPNVENIDHNLISIRGVFADNMTIMLTEVHGHHPWFREYASYLGLLMILVLWSWTLISFIYSRVSENII